MIYSVVLSPNKNIFCHDVFLSSLRILLSFFYLILKFFYLRLNFFFDFFIGNHSPRINDSYFEFSFYIYPFLIFPTAISLLNAKHFIQRLIHYFLIGLLLQFCYFSREMVVNRGKVLSLLPTHSATLNSLVFIL